MTSQLYSLKQENKRLKSIALTNVEIESMLKENKEMKLQLQQIKIQSELNGGLSQINPGSIASDLGPTDATPAKDVFNAFVKPSEKVTFSNLKVHDRSNQNSVERNPI